MDTIANTKPSNSRERLAEWTAIIKDCKNSGLKISEYCREHNLSYDAYRYWRRKINDTAARQAGFVGLFSERGSDNQLIIKSDGIEIVVNNDTPTELVAGILGLLRNAG